MACGADSRAIGAVRAALLDREGYQSVGRGDKGQVWPCAGRLSGASGSMAVGQRKRVGAGVMRLECEGVEVPHLRRTPVGAISDVTDTAVTGPSRA